MIDKIKEIISENSEEKHFVEYGKGVFATDDAVDVMAEEIVKLFAIPVVIQQHEPLVGFFDWWMKNSGDFDFGDSNEDVVNVYLANL